MRGRAARPSYSTLSRWFGRRTCSLNSDLLFLDQDPLQAEVVLSCVLIPCSYGCPWQSYLCLQREFGATRKKNLVGAGRGHLEESAVSSCPAVLPRFRPPLAGAALNASDDEFATRPIIMSGARYDDRRHYDDRRGYDRRRSPDRRREYSPDRGRYDDDRRRDYYRRGDYSPDRGTIHRRCVTTAIKVSSVRPSTQLMTHCGGGTCGRQSRRRSMNLAA